MAPAVVDQQAAGWPSSRQHLVVGVAGAVVAFDQPELEAMLGAGATAASS